MRAVIQRVAEASVTVEGEPVAAIGTGLLILVGAATGDGPVEADVLADKVVGLRIFPDREGKMNLSVAEAGGSVLVVSQFTLLADVQRGRRPSFTAAASPPVAGPLVDRVVERIGEQGVPSFSGTFGAHMEVRLLNDGPVTIVLDIVDGRVG